MSQKFHKFMIEIWKFLLVMDLHCLRVVLQVLWCRVLTDRCLCLCCTLAVTAGVVDVQNSLLAYEQQKVLQQRHTLVLYWKIRSSTALIPAAPCRCLFKVFRRDESSCHKCIVAPFGWTKFNAYTAYTFSGFSGILKFLVRDGWHFRHRSKSAWIC